MKNALLFGILFLSIAASAAPRKRSCEEIAREGISLEPRIYKAWEQAQDYVDFETTQKYYRIHDELANRYVEVFAEFLRNGCREVK